MKKNTLYDPLYFHCTQYIEQLDPKKSWVSNVLVRVIVEKRGQMLKILVRTKSYFCLAQCVPTFYWQTLHSFSEDQPN